MEACSRGSARSTYDWFKELLELPNGILSHDIFTVGRLFVKFDLNGFYGFFTRRVYDISVSLNGVTVAIDGKTNRGSYDKSNGKSAIHIVIAWHQTAVLCSDN